MGYSITRTKYDGIVNELLRSKVYGIYRIGVQEPVQKIARERLMQQVSGLIENHVDPQWVVHVDMEYFDGVAYGGYWKFEKGTLGQALNVAREVLLRNEERCRIWHRVANKMEELETYNMSIEGARTYKRTWFNENYERELRENGL